MKTFLIDAVYCFIVESKGGFSIFIEMYELLESYPNRKILLTGARDEDIERYGLDKVPYEYFTLKSDPKKSNPEYYTTMLRHFHMKPDDVVYVEHNPDAVESARSVGIETYLYDREKKDLDALEKFLSSLKDETVNVL